MKTVIRMCCLFALVFPAVCYAQANPQTAQKVNEQNSGRGIKDALILSTSNAVAKLGVVNGFLNNEKVKIPMPPRCRR